MFRRNWFAPMLNADGGGAAGGDGAGAGTQGGEGGQSNGGQAGDGQTGGQQNPGDKSFTQKELDDILTKRLARERKAWQDQMEEEKKKAAMTEAEKLKAEKEEAEKKAQAVQQTANQRLLTAEAKIQASALGIKPDRLGYALKLADLSGIEVKDDGSIDTAAVKSAIETVLKTIPELKGQVQQGGTGGASNPGGGQGGQVDFRTADKAALAAELAKYGLRVN